MLSQISNRQKLFVMIGIMLCILLAALDQTIVATALPRIVQEFNGLEHLSWVITSYLLASTVAVPIWGKLSDIYGRKYFILAGVIIFLIGSALSGVSQNMFQLIIFRAIQGLGGGALFANAFAIIGDLFPPAERGKWQGLTGGAFGLASVIGPSLGGWLTDNASWRWNFYINIPVGILAFLVIWFLLPKIAPDIEDKSIDYKGSLFLTTGLTTLMLGLIWGGTQYPWASVQIISLFIAAAVSLLLFIWSEKNAVHPIVPLDLFKNNIFSVSMIVTFLMGISMFGAILYVPLFAQLVLGVSATNSGAILTPMMMSFVTSSIVTGQIVSRTGRYKLLAVFGIALAAISLFFLSRMTASTTYEGLLVLMITTGIGIGTTLPIFTLSVQNAFPHSRIGVVTASTQLFRSIGGTVGTAVLGSILNNNLTKNFSSLSSDPFIKMISQFNPSVNFSKVDANVLQAMLTGPAREQINQKLSQLPFPVQQQVYPLFDSFILKTKDVFASSVSQVFLIASVITAFAFVASFFLKEVPLRSSHDSGPTEAGKELAVEEGNMEGKDIPIL